MDRDNMNNILNDLGWEQGKIPILNSDNKALQEEVFALQHELQSKKNVLEDIQERIFSMSQHKKNVEQELQHTQQLLSAVTEEINTEEHMLKICNGEKGRLIQEESRVTKDLKELKDKINEDENIKFKINQEIERLREQLKIDKKELESWLEVTAAKDEDALTIQKYRRMDETKVSELSLQINHLTDEVKNRRNTLDAEATETLTTQVALDKTAEEFRRCHLERHELIERWEHTLKMMNRRDKEMDILNNQIHLLKTEINRKKSQLEEKTFFWQNELENNKQLENKIVKVEKEGAKYRIEHQEAEIQKANFHDELETLKRIVDRTAIDLEVTRSQVRELKKIFNIESKKNEDVKLRHEELVKKLQIVCECSLTAKEKADEFDKLLKAEQKEQENINRELQELRSLKYRKEQELLSMQNELTFLEAKVRNSQTAVRNMNNKINRLDQDGLKQEGMLYNQDLIIENLSQRISRMQGQVNTDDMNKYKAKIVLLHNELDEKNSGHKTLEIQLSKLCDDIVKLEVNIKMNAAEMDDLHGKIDEYKLYNDSSDKLLKKMIRDNQELMVKENMEKLIVKRLRDSLYDKAYQVLSQEERKLQVETTMKERQHEINIHKDMIMSQIKFADGERQEINMEYQERKGKITKLSNRHHILMKAMSPPEGEEVKSQAYYVIKAAQEKEELQRFGDELDAKICKTEKENRALDNTIKLLNTSNESFRKSFNTVHESSEDMAEKVNYEGRFRSLQDEIRHKRRQVKEIEHDIQTMEITLENKIKENETMQNLLASKTNQLQVIEKDLADLNIKLDRAKTQNIRLINLIQASRYTTTDVPEQADIELRGLVELNKTLVAELIKIAQHHDQRTYENLLLYLSQANIPVHTPPGVASGESTNRSNTSSNATSSAGSSRSRKKMTKQISMVEVGADLRRDDGQSSDDRGSSLSGGSRLQRLGSSHSSSDSSRSSRSSSRSKKSAHSFTGHFKR